MAYITSPKIDDLAVDGLLGVNNSLAYKVHEIEKHFHSHGIWFGLAGTPDAELHRADLMDGVILPFDLLSGASDFGNWTQILGSDDTPVKAGYAKFDLHLFLVTNTDSTTPFIMQIIKGESADFAAKIAAKDYSTVPYVSVSNNNDSGISFIQQTRVNTGQKLWVRVANIGATGKTLSAYFGLHEYVG